MNARRTYPEGITCWVDIEEPDVEEAARFYGALFGWTFLEAESKPRYFIAQRDGQDAAGIGQRPVDDPVAGPAAWNTYISVRDLNQTAAHLVSAGGRITESPSELVDAALTASCVDPEGIPFRLWQPLGRQGVQVANTPGAWNFSDLVTADPSAAIAFYGGAFGWIFDDLGFATMIRQPGYGDHLAATSDPGIHARQSGDKVPAGFADAFGWLIPAEGEPHWHVTFTVADRDDAAATAEQLGGIVMATNDTDWTRDAHIRDPQGAIFTVSQYSPTAG
ncbi:MAG TPA: VOC family protein [Propionibacteriaceae bacterium]|nr:VOC family protein [Propionibacteriaceae bacterium]